MKPTDDARVLVAVLDDYQGLAPPIFKTLEDVASVHVFSDTLRPYNHPDTSDSDRDALVDRLAPFTVICSQC